MTDLEGLEGGGGLWRIRRRNGSTEIVDARELRRLRGLKRRTFVAVEPARIHQCTACGKRDAWRDDWGWYGSMNDLDNMPPGESPPKWCSEECRQRLIADKIVPRNMRRLD